MVFRIDSSVVSRWCHLEQMMLEGDIERGVFSWPAFTR